MNHQDLDIVECIGRRMYLFNENTHKFQWEPLVAIDLEQLVQIMTKQFKNQTEVIFVGKVIQQSNHMVIIIGIHKSICIFQLSYLYLCLRVKM